MKKTQPLIYTNEEMLTSIKCFIEENEGDASAILYREQGRKPAYSTILYRFGTWTKAVGEAEKLAEWEKKEKRMITRRKTNAYEIEDVLESVRRFVRENGGQTSSCLYRKQKRTPSYATIVNTFGKWEDVLRQAGCLTQKEKTRQACMNSVKRFLEENKERQSSSLYIKQKRVPTAACIIQHFGSWKQAIETVKNDGETIG